MDRITIAIIIAISVIAVSAIIGVLKNLSFHKKDKIKKSSTAAVEKTFKTHSSVKDCKAMRTNYILLNAGTKSADLINAHQRIQDLNKPKTTDIERYTFKANYNKYTTKYDTKEKNAA